MKFKSSKLIRMCLAACILLLTIQSLCAEKPYWWERAHKDDEFFMYQRGAAENCDSEQEALEMAVAGARTILMDRIGIMPALLAAGLTPSPAYALVNCTEADASTERTKRKWAAWVLLKYPQYEKAKMLERWNTSLASIDSFNKMEASIPSEFDISLTTDTGRTEYYEGESVYFCIRTERDAYMILLDHQSDDTTVLLFPNRFHPDCLIRAGQTVIIPDPRNASFQLVVGEPFGDDRIELIASSEMTSLQDKMADMLAAMPNTNVVAASSRGLFVQGVNEAVRVHSRSVLWSSAELFLSTYGK